MKIIVICNVLNEERNIASFCENYGFADQILLTDGGSQDRTAEIAKSYENVQVMDVSNLRIESQDAPGGFYTNEPAQINILIAWAKQEGADWIIKDDCDCWPNPALRRGATMLLMTPTLPVVFVYRLYIWGQDQYFPKMNEPGPSLWAWKPGEINIYADESNPAYGAMRGIPDASAGVVFEPPYACLHYFAPDEETIRRKQAIKRARGKRWDHPLKSVYAPPEPLPDWAIEEL